MSFDTGMVESILQKTWETLSGKPWQNAPKSVLSVAR